MQSNIQNADYRRNFFINFYVENTKKVRFYSNLGTNTKIIRFTLLKNENCIVNSKSFIYVLSLNPAPYKFNIFWDSVP